MRRFLKLLVLLIVVASAVLFARKNIFVTIMQEPETAERVVVKEFDFQNPSSIKEWEEKSLSRKDTQYLVSDYDGEQCVKAVSNDSASSLYYKQKLSYDKWPIISWDWRVDKFPERSKVEELDTKKEFDFGAQVYIVFYSRFFLNARAIQYVWAEEVPVGAVSDSPYTKNVKIMVLESGPSTGWKHEERNIRDDYKFLFGEKLDKDVDAVAFMTDSDSTKSSAVAYYDNFEIGFLGGDSGPIKPVEAEPKTWLSNFMFLRPEERRKDEVSE